MCARVGDACTGCSASVVTASVTDAVSGEMRGGVCTSSAGTWADRGRGRRASGGRADGGTGAVLRDGTQRRTSHARWWLDLRHRHARLALRMGRTLLVLLRRSNTSRTSSGWLPAGATCRRLYKDLTSGIRIPLGDPTGRKLRRWLSHYEWMGVLTPYRCESEQRRIETLRTW